MPDNFLTQQQRRAREYTHQPHQGLTPRQEAIRSAVGNAFMSVVPGVGDVMDAKEGYDTMRKAGGDFSRGNYASGVGNMLSGAAIGASAAIPFLGMGGIKRAAENVGEAARYYRATNTDSPVAGSPMMMFVKGDPSRVEHYGKNMWTTTGDGAVDVEELRRDAYRMLRQNGYEKEAARAIVDDMSPENIVNSAGAWDDPDFVQQLWDAVLDRRGVRKVVTPDGLLHFDDAGWSPDIRRTTDGAE